MSKLKEIKEKLDGIAFVKKVFQDWETMICQVREEGYQEVLLRDVKGFQSRMFIHPLHQGTSRGMILLCAGGGFIMKSSTEAKPVAEYFFEKGFNVALLDYHVADLKHLGGDPLAFENASMEAMRDAAEDGKAAVRYLRANAKQLGIPEDKIAIGGFSAGGMISALTSCWYDLGDLNAEKLEDRVSSRPDATLVLYGAFNITTGDWGPGQFDAARQARKSKVDPVRQIHADCPPMFVFQTHADDPHICLQFCMELANYGVPYELHTFEQGPHGGALFDGKFEGTPLIPHTARWAELAAEWLEGKGF